ncbi:nucleoside recognition domain-containing protein [Amphibacillus cookii]|uniref:nucleoside recognition domain-containing protein n=1 Tax=Amphibacillus cookii TaxID=767787 RepID=UPI00195D40DA|nr:nucleoside recognition domain-containing protein [Amphibacillus cookii]MBM7541528.1 hypothetical protein [Amphibacillus cookii]
MKATFIRGLKQGLHVAWTLSKVIFPITVIVTILQYTPILPWLIEAISPVMRIFGLSGEAAVPLVLGNSLNLYAGIAAIVSFDFTVKEVFIMAVMLSFSHNLFVESTVALKVGVRWPIVIGVRLALAGISALLIHLIWSGGEELAQYGFMQSTQASPSGMIEIGIEGIRTATSSIFQLGAIVIPLMVIMQYFRELGWMAKISLLLSPFTRLLGIKSNASMTLVAGLTIGLAFGAGVMVQAVRQDGVAKKDMYLSFIFLVACHAVIEDTLIFIPLGIPVWPLLIIRLTTAIALTATIAFLWNRAEIKQRKEQVNYGN